MRYIQISRPLELIHVFEDYDLICVYHATEIKKTYAGDYFILQHGKIISVVYGPVEITEIW